MKGIILAGGFGTRLYPLTTIISKHLLPIYDKPLIYYPLSILMIAGIKDILIISTKDDIPTYQKLLGDGSKIGLSLHYAVQDSPNGIPEAFLIGEKFIENDSVALILGDNIFYGQILSKILLRSISKLDGATVFAIYSKHPKDFGVLGFGKNSEILSIEEKPKKPKSNFIVPGLYLYDNSVVELTKQLKPSARGELEITDLNVLYLKQKKLHVQFFGRGIAWFDTGTHNSLLEASQFISTVQNQQGLYVACIEEIAFNLGYIDEKQLRLLARGLQKTDYGKYLLNLSSGQAKYPSVEDFI
jgi:glucose-1-phosphate thymidylyltransferase